MRRFLVLLALATAALATDAPALLPFPMPARIAADYRFTDAVAEPAEEVPLADDFGAGPPVRLVLDDRRTVPFWGRFEGRRLLLINDGPADATIGLLDGHLPISLEVEVGGEWRVIESPYGACGQNCSECALKAMAMVSVVVPRYAGPIATRGRYAMRYEDSEIVSADFPIAIQPGLLERDALDREWPGALAELGAAAVEPLREVVRGGVHDRAAAWALGRIGPPAASAVDELCAIIRAQPCCCDQEIDALACIGPAARQATPTLLAVIRERGNAARALHTLGPSVIPDLVAALDDQFARATALQALARHGRRGAPALKRIRELLHEPGVSLTSRIDLAEALFFIAGDIETALATARAGIDAPDPGARRRAIELLGLLTSRCDEASALIEPRLRDPDDSVVSAAKSALWRLAPSGFVQLTELPISLEASSSPAETVAVDEPR